MLSKRLRSSDDVNYWPSMVDTVFILLIVFIFILFINYLSSLKYLVIKDRQGEMETMITSSLLDYKQDISIETDGNLQRIRFSDRVLFNKGSDALKPRGQALLSALGELLRKKQLYSRIQVEGHTDDLAIGPRLQRQFKSNWELSVLRATSVVKYFQHHVLIDPERVPMTAMGYAQYRPISADKDPDGQFTEAARNLNRRIEIVLVYLEKDLLAE